MYFTLMIRNRARPFLGKDMHFKEIYPMRLRNRLKGNRENFGAAYCVQELSSMVSCMKRTDFDEAPCAKEIALFQTCVDRESKAIKELREAMQEGNIAPDAVRLSYRQLNNIFEKWPLPKAKSGKSWVLPQNIKYSQHDF